MAKKGIRANKPEDEKGTINDPNLYRGKYREDVNKEDEEDGQRNWKKAKAIQNNIVKALKSQKSPGGMMGTLGAREKGQGGSGMYDSYNPKRKVKEGGPGSGRKGGGDTTGGPSYANVPKGAKTSKDARKKVKKDSEYYRKKNKKNVERLRKMGYNITPVGEGIAEAKENAIDVARRVVQNKQHEKGLDLTTANFIMQVYNAYKKNPALQKKLEKLPLKKMIGIVYKLIK